MSLPEELRDWRPLAAAFLKMKKERASGELFDRAEALLAERIKPSFVYLVSPVAPAEGGTFVTRAGLVVPGKDVARLLADYPFAALMCATLGEGAESAVRFADAQDRALGLVTDAAASAMAELEAEHAQKSVAEQAGAKAVSPRFSPGYGDLGLEIQKDLLLSLNAARRLGISLSPGGLMLPRKTVTAIFGVRL